MSRSAIAILAASTIAGIAAYQQSPADPFPAPIPATEGAIPVNFVELATIPDIAGVAPRTMSLATEPGGKRIFVSTMVGPLYSLSADGKNVVEYLDVNAATWNTPVLSRGPERGVQSIAFHPQFNQRGSRGYGKFYTYIDTPVDATGLAKPDFVPVGATNHSHDTLLLEWTATDPTAEKYAGSAPRELFRAVQPYSNHNGGQIAFNPLTTAGSPEFGLLYVGLADGGSGGDPHLLAQNLQSAFGKILRVDPLGNNSANGRYGIPASNPFVSRKGEALGEIYAYGVRNPQRFSWDSKTGRMFLAEIGQNTVEEISIVTAGANLGWNKWEASFAFDGRGSISVDNQRSEAGMTWPVVEYDHRDPLLVPGTAAITGIYVYRQSAIRQLANMLVFGDIPSGEIFYVDADKLPNGGQSAIRRVLLNDKGTPKPLLQLIREKNAAQGKPAAPRADLRLGMGAEGQIFVMNKRDGVIRMLVPDAK